MIAPRNAPVRVRLTMLMLAVLGLSTAFAQGSEAQSAQARLLQLPVDAQLFVALKGEVANLTSIEDSVWLLSSFFSKIIDPLQRKACYKEHASLLELLGRYAEAAASWESAARSVSGIADASCLLSSAACRLLAGDVVSANGLATAVAFSSPDPASEKLAGIILGWVELAQGNKTKALSIALDASADSEQKVVVAALLLARAASEGTDQAQYDQRLRQYATRPEPGSTMPMLLVIGSTNPGMPIDEKPAPTPKSDDATQLYYQVGAFRDVENARVLAAKLSALGLKAIVKTRGQGELILVLVDPGTNRDRTVLTLKDAGYEAWVVDAAP